MKRKIYLICYAVLQMLASVYTMFNANSIAKESLKMIKDVFKEMPAEMQTMINEVYTLDSMVSSVWMTAIVALVLGAILLWLFVRDRVPVKKGLAITLTVISMLLGVNDIVTLLAVVALVLIIGIEKDKVVKKEKKEIKKLRELKVTGKDLLWVVVLVLAYSTQFIVPLFIENATLGIIFEILYYVLIFALVLYIFGKRLKRDFKAFKENFGTYIGYIFKWWGIMLGLSIVAAGIRLLLGGDVETANQAGLNSMPLWYVGPLAMIWAPFVEEGIFRGGLRRFVKNDKVFVVLSALLFGLLHTVGSEAGLYNIFIQSLQYMVMGGVMAHVYTKTNNICVNMGVHCVQNTFGVVMMFLMSIL
ncbi:MAG: CPBP family intramembrane metalloprotease [Bacilli bacterium]|nr:CPBP family intramembrane metalloprotease [Bacilli bacterium]